MIHSQTTCDHCGKRITGSEVITRGDYRDCRFNNLGQVKTFDLCYLCVDKLEKFLTPKECDV